MARFQLKYTPHPFQVEFHNCKKRFRSLIAGRRGGKTTAGAIEAVRMAVENPGSIGWCISPTYPMSRDIVIPEVKKWLPREMIVEWNKTDKTFRLTNGSLIQFKSGDNPDTLRGPGLNWLWMDEASFMKKEVWDTIYPALTDKHGIAWITTTPQGFDWVYESFYKAVQKDPEEYHCVRFKSVDNPHLDPKLVEKARQDLAPQFFRQEYEASFETFTGRVYQDFERETHVIKPFDIPNNWTILRSLDFGFKNPFVCLWIAIDYDENVYVFDEHYKSQMLLKEHVNVINAKTGRRPIAATYRDPSAAQEGEELVSLGIYTTPAVNTVNSAKDMSVGINAVASRLQVHPVTQKPRLFVFDTCVNTIEEFEKYRWDADRKDINLKEVPKKFMDHAMDALRYALSTYAKEDESYAEDFNLQYNQYGEPIYNH